MSFTFNWPRFSDQFHYDAIQMLNTALNKGNKPPIIADKIEVVELEMGTQPPELEIRDIGELTVDQFRGIFRLTYSGDAHLVLKTKVQANPLNHKLPDIHLMTGSHGMLAAKEPLVVPMLLRLSHFRLSSYVVLVVSKQKGITLVFKTDPLQNVDINSTFDSIAVIQKYIQREIEGQLRQMFREDLPGIIHRLSQQWVKAKVEAPYLNKRPPPVQVPKHQRRETMSNPDVPLNPAVGSHPHPGRAHSVGQPSIRRSRSVLGDTTTASLNRQINKAANKDSSSPQTSSTDVSSHGEYESFDPTYGLRPEGLPTKSGFKAFSNLFAPNKGLADLAEEDSTDEDEDFDDDGVSTTFDVVDWEDTVPGISPPSSHSGRNRTPEYETIPAVGGGTITRPRILHSQSSIQAPQGITPHSPQPPLQSRSQANVRPGDSSHSVLARHHPSGSAYFSDIQSLHNTVRPPFNYPLRPQTPGSSDAGLSDDTDDPYPLYPNLSRRRPSVPAFPSHTHTPDTNPIYVHPPKSERRLSVSSSVSYRSTATATSLLHPNSAFSTSPVHNSISSSLSTHASDSNSKHVLRPSLNSNSIHHLSTLSHSNHTLSPYTRSLSHFTVRSVPPRSAGGGLGNGFGIQGGGTTVGDRQPIKAKRKRLFRIGAKNPTDSPTTSMTADTLADTNSTGPGKVSSNGDAGLLMGMTSALKPGGRTRHLRQHQFVPPEFDAEDMDRYFRSNEDLSSIPPAPSTVDSGRMSSTPPRFSTVQAAQQHMQQRPLASVVEPRVAIPGIGGSSSTAFVSARRR
ncbi:hypothetical protein Agabi119p4_4156 [Agaricus bisporus var. burnettii]|uniref:Mitochondrial distribution and morphology protein 34 n=2 Tax=Agaricus bisporus var. burnettii TaxID=192524 RepID=A0A8H7F2W0_AGABI|nr:hypothetical protein Agabi119p4_4156 [Agaricus bisporus var. burnettii]